MRRYYDHAYIGEKPSRKSYSYNISPNTQGVIVQRKGHHSTRKKFSVKFVGYVIIVLAICLAIMAKYTSMIELSYGIVTLTDQYSKMKNENQELLSELAEKVSTEGTRSSKKDKMGGKAATTNKIVYVSVPKKDYTRSVEN